MKRVLLLACLLCPVSAVARQVTYLLPLTGNAYVPLDFTSVNKIWCIGGGGNGAASPGTYFPGGGGGGGGYSEVDNYDLTPGQQLGYSTGAGDNFLCMSTSPCDYTHAFVAAKAGSDGKASNASDVADALGGQASLGIGTVKYSGGTAYYAAPYNFNGSGGGGAAGPNGDGLPNGNASHQDYPNSGAGDAGLGGAQTTGGANGRNGGPPPDPGTANAGTEIDGVNGAGSGASASGGFFGTVPTSATGGQYGGGGAGGSNSVDVGGGNGSSGGNGICGLTYTVPDGSPPRVIIANRGNKNDRN